MNFEDVQAVYVQLLDEGTTCYRPAPFVVLADDTVRLLAHPGYCPEDEEWEFKPESIVRVAWKELSGGRVAVAVSLIGADKEVEF